MSNDRDRSERLLNAICKAANLDMSRADLEQAISDVLARIGARGELPSDVPAVEQLADVFEALTVREARQRARSARVARAASSARVARAASSVTDVAAAIAASSRASIERAYPASRGDVAAIAPAPCPYGRASCGPGSLCSACTDS